MSKKYFVTVNSGSITYGPTQFEPGEGESDEVNPTISFNGIKAKIRMSSSGLQSISLRNLDGGPFKVPTVTLTFIDTDHPELNWEQKVICRVFGKKTVTFKHS